MVLGLALALARTICIPFDSSGEPVCRMVPLVALRLSLGPLTWILSRSAISVVAEVERKLRTSLIAELLPWPAMVLLILSDMPVK